MQICEVTGSIHRNPRELKAELARLDVLVAAMEDIEVAFANAFTGKGEVPEAVGKAWNAASDAVQALWLTRADVEANPKPIPGSEAGTYRLAAANID